MNVETKEQDLKSASSFQFGSYNHYKTSGDFIGVVHQGYWDDNSGDEYDIYVYLTKTDCWLCGWDVLWQGICYGELYSPFYYAMSDFTSTGNPWYKIGAGVYKDARTNGTDYRIAFGKNTFYGRRNKR